LGTCAFDGSFAPRVGKQTTMASRRDDRLPRTFAQWYCILAGASLLLAGVLGFAADAGFDTGSGINGDKLIVFEVNGWHNLVHIASGLLLLAAANTRPTARTVAFAFGAVYGLVTLWGLVDGDEVFNLIPINPADNLLHLFLSAAAILCAWQSPTTARQQRDRREGRRGRDHGVDAPVLGGTTSGEVKTPSGTGHDTR
jgi:hypothetical protein